MRSSSRIWSDGTSTAWLASPTLGFMTSIARTSDRGGACAGENALTLAIRSR